MSQGQLGVLHTKSSYAPGKVGLPGGMEDTRTELLKRQIRDLKEKEDDFAKRFGCNNVEAFIKTVREVFHNNAQDLQALQQFSSTNLRAHLEQFKGANANMFLNQNIQIQFKATQAKAKKIFDGAGGNSTITWEMDGPDDNIFHLEWDTAAIKRIVNKVAGRHFQYRTSGLNNIEKMIDFLTSEANDLIDVRIGPGQDTIENFMVQNAVSPFEIKPSDFEKFAANNPQIAQDIGNRIRTFIISELCVGASKDFSDTVGEVLDQKIGSNPANWAFFMGGKGWVTSAVGSLGEIQAAVLFQYVAKKTSNRVFAAKVMEIIGDKRNGYGEQFRSDLELFEAFGIQIKNYSGSMNSLTNEERTVVVNLHPLSVPSLNSDGVVDYMLNSYFNTSLTPYSNDELNEFFETHAEDILNLDFSVDAHLPDKVSFYMIGLNLIPGSAILNAAYIQTTIKAETNLINSYEGVSDEDYNPWMSGDSEDAKFHLPQPFLKWWVGPPESGNFEPTDDNGLSAIDSLVTIKTKFTYSALFDKTYRLFD